MRLKEIEQGMDIHCKTEDEAEKLLKYLHEFGYKWFSGMSLLKETHYGKFKESTCYTIMYDKLVVFGHIEDSENTIEFSDLIIPELTAEEVLSVLGEIKRLCADVGTNCRECPLDRLNNKTCGDLCDIENFTGNEEVIIAICQKWKSDHERKEPEVEWVYRVFGAENYGEKFFDTEEEAIKRCEELAKQQKTRQYTRYERVCRVKVN
ncbi:MAG: hypothetical protein ACI4ES_12250 [Roseburia sp.]